MIVVSGKETDEAHKFFRHFPLKRLHVYEVMTASVTHAVMTTRCGDKKLNVSAPVRASGTWSRNSLRRSSQTSDVIQQLWRLIGSRITFFVSIHHSVTSSLARCSAMLTEPVGKLILWLLLFISFCQQWGWGGFHLTLCNDNLSKIRCRYLAFIFFHFF